MNLNNIFKYVSDRLCECAFVRFQPYLRPIDDLRLVLYHGIGGGSSPCFKHLNDEISEEKFEMHIEYLCKKYTMLSMDDSIDQLSKNKFQKKPICSISFDDGLRSVYLKAYPILIKYNLPATIFLNTAVIGNTSLTDLHLLSYIFAKFDIGEICTLMNRLKDDYICEVPGAASKTLEWYVNNNEKNLENRLLEKLANHLCLDLGKIAQEENIYLNWDEIDEMSSNGFLFCSHTHNHKPLAFFTNINITEEEIEKAYAILKANKCNLNYVSFPFGMRNYYGEAAVKSAFRIGHKYIVEVGNGTNSLSNILENKILSRVSLESSDCNYARLYSAIEMRPLIKTKIKKYFKL